MGQAKQGVNLEQRVKQAQEQKKMIFMETEKGSRSSS